MAERGLNPRIVVMLVVVWFGVAGLATWWGSTFPPFGCTEDVTTAGFGRWVAFVWLLVVFVLGHFAGTIRADFLPEDRETAEVRVRPSAGARRLLQLLLLGLLVLVALALVFETVGTAGIDHYLPLTSYAHCGISKLSGGALAIGTCVVFLVGHWLWYPGPSRRPRSSEQ